MKFAIIGGGLVGMGTALELLRLAPDAKVRVLEKEARVGQHQSTHNSGVLHAGLYYKPGSLKARLAVQGIRRMVAFCQQHGIAHEVCGKLVVATTEDETGRLRTLVERGTQNGLIGLRWLDGDALREIEPHAAGLAAVHVPEEGIVDYHAVCAAMARELGTLGADVTTSARLVRAVRADASWRLETTAGDFASDFIINCAGLHSDRVAEAARRGGVKRLVFASSAAVYGDTKVLPVAEDAVLRPISPYGSAKLASEHLLLAYAASHGITVRVQRYFNVFGPRQDPSSPYSGVISIFARRMRQGKAITIYGDGKQTRDFIDVADVARANVIAATKPGIASGVANICTGRPVSLLALTKHLSRISPLKPLHFAPARPGDIRHSAGATAAAQKALGFKAQIDVAKSLVELADEELSNAAE